MTVKGEGAKETENIITSQNKRIYIWRLFFQLYTLGWVWFSKIRSSINKPELN